jgi:hypothetical protein
MLVWLALTPLAASAEVYGTCATDFEADFRPGGLLNMRIRSGDIDIVGADTGKIRIACDLKDTDRADEVRIAFKPSGDEAELHIHGGPASHFRVRIEVPKRSNLYVRAPAGDLTVWDVTGHKDIAIKAGDLVIDVGDPADYAHAEASVTAGDLNAGAFGVNKGGLFRSFRKSNPGGRYRIHARVVAGDLVLR